MEHAHDVAHFEEVDVDLFDVEAGLELECCFGGVVASFDSAFVFL